MTNESIVQRLSLRENQIFLALTIIIAIIAGLSAVLFTLAIAGTKHVLFGMSPSAERLILTPTIVSLVTGFLLAKFFPEARASGVPQTEAAFHLNQGIIRPIVPLGKFLTGVLCVGSGPSMAAKVHPFRLAPAWHQLSANGSAYLPNVFKTWCLLECRVDRFDCRCICNFSYRRAFHSWR